MFIKQTKHKVVTTCFFICICGRFFEDQPNENCSYFSEKALKGMFFLCPRSSKIILTKKKKKKKKESEEKKMRRRKKSNGCTLSFL